MQKRYFLLLFDKSSINNHEYNLMVINKLGNLCCDQESFVYPAWTNYADEVGGER
jgi:hypothetical protein